MPRVQRGCASESPAIGRQFTLQPLGVAKSKWYVAPADPFPGTRGRTDGETAPQWRARCAELVAASRACSHGWTGFRAGRRRCRATPFGSNRHCAAIESLRERDAASHAPLHAHPRRRHERRMHRFRAAQHQLRPFARRPRAHGPPERLRQRHRARATAHHRR